MIGRCEAWDLVLPVPDDGGEPVYVHCPNSGRRIQETDPLGRPRHRTVCGPHGLDTAPATAKEVVLVGATDADVHVQFQAFTMSLWDHERRETLRLDGDLVDDPHAEGAR